LNNVQDYLQKITNVLRVCSNLAENEQPFINYHDALDLISSEFDTLQREILRASRLKNTNLTRQLCRRVDSRLAMLMPIIGMLERSTNSRNAFELIDPLQTIAAAVIPGTAKVILSFEWQYIPFTYPQTVPVLASYSIIGMPATEVANGLLFPVATHELAHSIWRNKRLDIAVLLRVNASIKGLETRRGQHRQQISSAGPKSKKGGTMSDILSDLDDIEARSKIVSIAVSHIEEMFCDFFAFYLFQDAYIWAFLYVVGEGDLNRTSEDYPSHAFRLRAMLRCAEKIHLTVKNKDDLVQRIGSQESDDLRSVPGIASKIVVDIQDSIWSDIVDICTEARLGVPRQDEVEEALQSFNWGVPALRMATIGELLVAAWRYYVQLTEGKSLSSYPHDGIDGLNELLFKSIEVQEFYRKTRKG
jgi:hypothetical protein